MCPGGGLRHRRRGKRGAPGQRAADTWPPLAGALPEWRQPAPLSFQGGAALAGGGFLSEIPQAGVGAGTLMAE